MNFTYETQGTNTYLVYTVSPEETIDSLSIGMLTNNKIHGLANTLFTQMDATKYIKYNVSAHIPASQFFAGAVNKKRLLGVFQGIVAAILSAEDYMIDEGSLLLDLDYIFADVSTCDTVLICLPIIGNTKRHDLGGFFKQIMFSTQFDQTENCDYVAKIINYLNSSPLFSLQDFSALLETLNVAAPKVPVQQPKVPQPTAAAEAVRSAPAPQPQKQQPQPVNPAPAPVPQPAKPAAQSVQAPPAEKPKEKKGFSLFKHKEPKKEAKAPAHQPAKQAASVGIPVPGTVKPAFEVPGQPAAVKPAASQPTKPAAPQVPPVQRSAVNVPTQQPVVSQSVHTQPQMPQTQSMNFGETTVLSGGGIGETTVLGATPAVQVKPHLIRAKNNEKIDLNKPVFRIGKEKSYVDYFIGDNSAISRSHANIISRDGEYFVVDTNSTNHTYVNGQMIQSNVETKIAHGAKIKFANEDFEFRLY